MARRSFAPAGTIDLRLAEHQSVHIVQNSSQRHADIPSSWNTNALPVVAFDIDMIDGHTGSHFIGDNGNDILTLENAGKFQTLPSSL
ncbi:hypothetical protein BRADI_2g35243v3 [Brachypodium distachyon]|uniref:Uncharacterized protein n=1 Tax=Brachypodium distachyon TaxID=15368 RepID=A0A2K2DBV9_BRADI|nr:hypothetical protein BRADI_2g35243v3 [Brachypodium distachyon]